MLRDMGKYYMCVDCLEEEEELRKKKVKAKAKARTKEVEVREHQENQDSDVETFNQRTLVGEMNGIFDN